MAKKKTTGKMTDANASKSVANLLLQIMDRLPGSSPAMRQQAESLIAHYGPYEQPQANTETGDVGTDT